MVPFLHYMTLEKYYIDPNELTDVRNWMLTQHWFVNINNADRSEWQSDEATFAWALATQLTNDGQMVDPQVLPNNRPLRNEERGQIKGVWRMPFGWSDESVKMRAPLVYELFEKVNSTFFDNKFTLDGNGEGIRATRSLWRNPNYKDIPDWGNFLKRGQTPDIWTCYANGRPNGLHCHGNVPEQKGNAHCDGGGDGRFTILVNVNPKWRATSGGEVIFHKTGDDGVIDIAELLSEITALVKYLICQNNKARDFKDILTPIYCTW